MSKKIIARIGTVLCVVGVVLFSAFYHVGYVGFLRVGGKILVAIGLMLLCGVGSSYLKEHVEEPPWSLSVLATIIMLGCGLFAYSQAKNIVIDCIEGPKTAWVTDGEIYLYFELPPTYSQYYLEGTIGGKKYSLPLGRDPLDMPTGDSHYYFITFYPHIECVLRCVIYDSEIVLTEEEFNALQG